MFEELIIELQAPARELLSAAGQAGLQPRVTSTVRTHSQQARLFRKAQAGLSAYPAAPPGLSAHEWGFAFDMVVTPMEALADVGYTWQTWGGIWGSQADPIHFEYPGFQEYLQSKVPEFGPTPLAAQLASPGPWWAFLPSYVDLLKGGLHYEHEAMCAVFGKNWC